MRRQKNKEARKARKINRKKQDNRHNNQSRGWTWEFPIPEDGIPYIVSEEISPETLEILKEAAEEYDQNDMRIKTGRK